MLQWGIIGPGSIARVFCNGLRFSKTGELAAVASRDVERAQKFATMFGCEKVHDSYDALLADDAIDAVYVATVHPAHQEWVVKAAQAGKPILVEKPMGVTVAEVTAMLDAAKEHDVFLMEAYMYRCHPQIEKMVSLIQDKAIGDVRVIRSAFGYHAGFNPESRAYNRDLAGGGIMDVGCYPASMSRLVAGAAVGKAFLDPTEVKATGVIGETGVDYYTTAVLDFEQDMIAQISTGVACNLPGEITVFGSEGILSLPQPWLPSSPCRTAKDALPLDTAFPSSEIHLQRKGQTETIVVDVDRDLFTYEADMVAKHIDARQAPVVSWDDSLGNMKVLEKWRAEIGLKYEQDG
ncbi:MAG: Gfo/Idh/MocA family oxidoreductase [Candidatus Latescibacteria bacterium]|nr:Gfo/Idh/MocA family oxidoreductase [Candidatus Latescibacterota bacterium]